LHGTKNENKYICSFSYPGLKAHAPYYEYIVIVTFPAVPHFSTLFNKDTVFGKKKKVIEENVCSDFLYKFV